MAGEQTLLCMLNSNIIIKLLFFALVGKDEAIRLITLKARGCGACEGRAVRLMVAPRYG